MKNHLQDITGVRTVIQLYLEGASGDTAKLKEAFHISVRPLLRSLMVVMVMVLFVAACSSDEPASITIEHKLDVRAQPIAGTFEVTEGADTLGCSGGTFVDDYDPAQDELKRVMTCSGPNTGTFTHTFDVVQNYTGPGDQNGPWRMLDATDDFTGLQGGGDWWGIGTTETITGDIEYTS